MNNREILINCFNAVFPSLTEPEIVKATTSSVRDWDSVAGVTLLAVIEEEFGFQLDPKDIQRLNSFESVLQYVENRRGEA